MRDIDDCERCMQTNQTIVRQTMGCGYAPTAPRGLPVMPWSFGWAKQPTVCAGYVCKLPEVIEASRARLHWSKGQLLVFTNGEQPSEALTVALELLEIEYSRLQEWQYTPESKGGGAK